MAELSKILEGKAFLDAKNLLTEDFGLIVKEDNQHPNLYLITWDKDKEAQYQEMINEHPFLHQCHGSILEKDTNRLICYTFGSRLEFNYEEDSPQLSTYGLNLENCQMEDSIEGTQLRLYHYQNEWIISTVRCIDAKRAFWSSKKSFADLYQEAIETMAWAGEKLNPKHCYALVLQHPDNQMVIKYEKANLVHVLTRDLSTEGFPEISVASPDGNIGLPVPSRKGQEQGQEQGQELTWESFLNMAKSYPNLDKEGYILKDIVSGLRLKVMSDVYRRVKELSGNVTPNNLIFHYLTLKKNGTLSDYLIHFPENGKKIRHLGNQLKELVTEIHRQYCEKFVNKTIKMNEVTFAFRPFIYEINGIHLKTREVINRKKVAEELYSQEVQKIAYIYNSYYFPKTDKKKTNSKTYATAVETPAPETPVPASETPASETPVPVPAPETPISTE